MATIAIKARAKGVDRVLRQFATASARLPEDTLAAQRELGKASEVVFGSHAPHKTGRLIRGIASTTSGGTVVVQDFASNPESGYDYVGVTRFGHRVDRIYPTHRSDAASVISTKRRRGGESLTHGFDSFKSRAALRFTIGGRTIFASSVRGYHPASDWAEDALPDVEAQAELVAARLGRKIEAHF